MCACTAHHMLRPELYFGHSQRQSSYNLPFHSPGLYESLFLLPPAAPPGDNRLLGCQAAKSSEMEGMTTYVPLGDRPGTEGEMGKQNGGTVEKRWRQESTEVKEVIVCDLTPQGNTECE